MFGEVRIGIDGIALFVMRVKQEITIVDALASSAFCRSSLRILMPGGYSLRRPRRRVVRGSAISKFSDILVEVYFWKKRRGRSEGEVRTATWRDFLTKEG
jgi:hypothetical protein